MSKDLNSLLTREEIQMANTHIKRCPTLLLGKFKLKQQSNTRTYLWLDGKKKPPYYPNCMYKNLSIAGGNEKGTVALEDSLAISSKAKHSPNIQYSNHVLRYLPNWFENICSYKNMPERFTEALFILTKTRSKQDVLQ